MYSGRVSGDPLGYPVRPVHPDIRDMLPGRGDGARADLDGK